MGWFYHVAIGRLKCHKIHLSLIQLTSVRSYIYKSKREIERINEGNKYFWEGLFVFLIFDTRKGCEKSFSCVEIIMILDTVRQKFLVLVSIFYRRIRTFFRVITYFIYSYLIIITYTINKKWWTNKRGGENLLTK